MWVKLNEEGKQVWGDVFPDGMVPVCSMSFQQANLGNSGGGERVILVNWAGLSELQKDIILAKISERSGAAKEVILKDILKIGLPLRERLTTGNVAMELRFFV
jgi:hypothetical protein